jgi:hypothetical protein
MTVVDFTPIINSVLGLVFVIIAGALSNFLMNHMKDKAAAAQLATALQNGLGAMQQAEQKGTMSHPIQLELPGITAAMGAGIQYVVNQVPDALLRLNISKEEIAEKLDARLGVKNIDTNVATAASSAPSPTPLAPVQDASIVVPSSPISRAPTSSSKR